MTAIAIIAGAALGALFVGLLVYSLCRISADADEYELHEPDDSPDDWRWHG